MSDADITIANVMLGRGLGGIEQAFFDYTDALTRAGFKPISIISTGAAIESQLRNAGFSYRTLSQWGWWDLFAAKRLQRIFQKENAAAVITHGNRALTLSLFASHNRSPVIAVAHNYAKGRYEKADLAIATTKGLRNHLAASRVGVERIVVISNAVRINEAPYTAAPFRQPPVIGFLGRMIDIKGLDVLCEALALLKSEGVSFRAILAGDGKERTAIEAKLTALGLQNFVEFPGWVSGEAEKQNFLRNIDIFCLPSLQEAFGIVLLEAWAVKLPIVTTDTKGPAEIVNHGVDGLVVAKGSAPQLAKALKQLLQNPEQARLFAENGFTKVQTNYSIDAMAARMKDLIGLALTGPDRE